MDLPSGGVPPLIDTPAGFHAAASALAAGQGPIAVDTERASGFRYDDRAFLLQIRRRGVGTLLLDPEGHRDDLTAALAPVLCGADWVIHAAASDLPCLAWLGLYPGSLFDTELASRLAGFDHVNLAAMTEQIFDVHLRKGHGAEDWSQRPLPENWLAYAALDVELLLDLAEAMAEILDAQGKLDWAAEEFEHIRATHADITEPASTTWQDTKGVSTLTRPEQLAVARELWLARETIAVDNDRAVSRFLPNKVLVEVARTLPDTPAQLARVRGFPGRRKSATSFWFQILTRARASDPATWPARQRPDRGTPSHQTWARDYPEAHGRLVAAREALADLAVEVSVPTENLLRPAVLRAAVWESTQTTLSPMDLADFLSDHEARAWQLELAMPLLSPLLTPVRG